MKRLMFALALCLFWLMSKGVSATPMGDELRKIDRGAVRFYNFCTYTVEIKNDSETTKQVIMRPSAGTGFFIEPGGAPHLALTAEHVVNCSERVRDIFPDVNPAQIVSFEARSSLKALYGSQYFNAVVVNHGADYARVHVDMGDTPHYHNPVLTDENAFDLGSEVMIRGFMPCEAAEVCIGDGWVHRLKFANVERLTLDKIYMQLNTSAYPGMSGSPVFILKDGRYYVVGILVMSYGSARFGTVDMSWATRLKKEYFEPPVGGKIKP